MLNSQRYSSNPEWNNSVHVSLPMLISLNQAASGVQMWRSRIRSERGSGHMSQTKGRGMEFDEVRPYMPGDDIRSIDWRVTARTGRTHTKLFREERERPVLLGIDLRDAMFFATRGVFKSVQAIKLAALMAWSAHQNGDRVGGQIFAETEYREIKPQNGKSAVLHFLKELSDLGAPPFREKNESDPLRNSQSLETAVTRLYRHSRPGSCVVIISDFRNMNEACEFHLARLARHCDVVLLLVFDALEIQLPVTGQYRFSDGQRDIDINTHDKETLRLYQKLFQQRFGNLRTLALRFGMRFGVVNTTDDPLQLLKSGCKIDPFPE